MSDTKVALIVQSTKTKKFYPIIWMGDKGVNVTPLVAAVIQSPFDTEEEAKDSLSQLAIGYDVDEEYVLDVIRTSENVEAHQAVEKSALILRLPSTWTNKAELEALVRQNLTYLNPGYYR
jgi:hypothetical protein